VCITVNQQNKIIAVDENPVSIRELTYTPTVNQGSVRIKYQHRRIRALKDVHLVLRIDSELTDRAKFLSVRQCPPWTLDGVGLASQGHDKIVTHGF
jgi:hypothetical protein